MNIPLIDLHAQYATLRPEVDDRIAEVISSAGFIGGPEVSAFAEEFGAFTGHPWTVPCGNGTDALELVLDAWGIGADDEVIVPAMSWISTSEVVVTRGARPVFVDIDPRTDRIDPTRVEAAITPATRAIIAVHLYGHPAQMTQLRAIADHHDLRLIEDCAQAHGARWEGQHVGTVGDAATYSFFPSKSLGTYGDAGLVGCGAEDLCTRVRALANHGMPGRRHYHAYHGRNSRMDALQAAVLRVKLPRLTDWIAARTASPTATALASPDWTCNFPKPSGRHTTATTSSWCVPPPRRPGLLPGKAGDRHYRPLSQPAAAPGLLRGVRTAGGGLSRGGRPE